MDAPTNMKPVFQAVGGILGEARKKTEAQLAEQRNELLARIKLLEDDLTQRNAYIEALTKEIAAARAEVAEKLQRTHTSASEGCHSLQTELAELRGQLARMPADPAPQVAELKGRLDQLERTPGPPGRDADPEVVARTLLTTDGFLALVRGVQGEQGPRGPAADPEELIQRLKADTEFQDLVRGLRGEPGAPGKAADAGEVAERLMQNAAFLAKVAGQAGRDGKDGAPGRPGEPGKDADPAEVAKALENNRTFCELVRGAKGDTGAKGDDGRDGKDADPVDVAKALARNEDFRALVRGEKGDTGDPGRDGRDANALDVAERLKQDKEFQLWLKPDPVEMGKLAAEELKRCDEFVRSLRGQDGAPGKNGADGAGVDVPFYERGQVYREGATVQCAFGKLYRAVRDTAQHPRGSDHWKRVGLYGFDWLGVKDEKKVYEPGDLYIDKGSTFLVLPDGRPKMFAQRGASGRQGEPGKDGKDGRDGATVVAGVLEGETFRFGCDDGTSFDVPAHELYARTTATIKEEVTRAVSDPETAVLMWPAIKARLSEDIEVDDATIALTAYRGVWMPDASYRKGDAVTWNKALWLCRESQRAGQPMSEEYWRHIAGSGGGSGVVVSGRGGVEFVPMPATESSAGSQGQMAWDGEYLAVCVAPNTWVFLNPDRVKPV